MENTAHLTVSSLYAGYGAGSILQGVDLDIHPGEIVATLGRNGVGKTTLMKAIIGLLKVEAGTITFRGENLTHLSADKRARRGIGYIPQGREIFPDLTVEENLRMGELINENKETARYDLVYDMFPLLKQRRHQKGGTLSGGQQQMLAIGRALVGNPYLLLLDEPSEGIQPNMITQIGQSLVQLNRATSLTIFIVEQNVGLIETIAQRAYVMDKGRMVAILTREELSERQVVLQYLAV